MKQFILILLFYSTLDDITCDTIERKNFALWDKLNNFTEFWSKSFIDLYKPEVEEFINSKNISKSCRYSIHSTFDGIQNLESWAIQMINSWGNFPAKGLLEGTFTDLGSYDQCLSIDQNEIIGSSQYCIIDMSLPLPQPMPIHHNLFHRIDVLPHYLKNRTNNVLNKLSKDASFFYWLSLRLGICAPNKCSLDDIKLLTKTATERMGLNMKKVMCEEKKETILNSIQMFAVAVLAHFVICCVTATVCQSFIIKKNSSIWILIDAFSMANNFKRLITVKTKQQLSCIHGIRFLTLLWIIYGHTVLWNEFQLFSRTFQAKQTLTSWVTQPILNAGNSVDTFFLISGILTSYVTFKITNANLKDFNKSGFFIARYLRLTPQLAIFMLITFLLPLLGSGPIWHEFIDPVINNCYENWWHNFIYLQNLIDVDKMCLLHCWFLAADMQMHWISFIVVLVMLRNIKLGLIFNFLVIIAFYISTSIMVFINDFPPVYTNTGRNEFYVNVFTNVLYFKPLPHGISFFIGVGLGYLVYKNRFTKISKNMVLLAWILIILGFQLTLSDTVFWNYGQPFNRYVSAIVFPSSRLLYAICNASLIWLCISGNGGFIDKLLSCKVFIPFARLTFSTYLTHSWSIWLYMGTRRQLIDTSIYATITIFLQHVFISFTFGLIFSLIIESPILNLLKHLLKYLKINTEYKNKEIQLQNQNLIIQ